MFSDILLTVDYDRTLTGPDGIVPERNLEAIRYFTEHGGAFTVNTGRGLPMIVNNILSVVPVSAPFLLYNGAAAWDARKEKLVFCREIDLNAGEVLQDIQAAFPELTVEIQGLRAHYALKKNAVWEAFSEENRCAWDYCLDGKLTEPFLKFAVYAPFRDTSLNSAYDISPEENAMLEEAIAYIAKRWGDRVDICRPCARILDVQAKGVSKLAAARELKKTLGRKFLICVGDAENDIPMLDGADFAYCPADGVVADRFPNVCKCAEGAVADVIYEKIRDILKNNLDNGA